MARAARRPRRRPVLRDRSRLAGFPGQRQRRPRRLYKSQKDGKIRCLAGWCLLKSVEQEELKLQSDLIEIVSLKEALPTKGEVAYTCKSADELGVMPGDIVGFKQNRDYRITIDGVEYYRTRAEDLMYVEI